MIAKVTAGEEYGTDRPCQIGRIEYTEGLHRYVALAFRYTDEPCDWFLTWVGEVGRDTARLPDGVMPSPEMLVSLAKAVGR